MIDLELAAVRVMDYPIEQGIKWKVTLTNKQTKRAITVDYHKGIGHYTLLSYPWNKKVYRINKLIEDYLKAGNHVMIPSLGLTSEEYNMMLTLLKDSENYKLSKNSWDKKFVLVPPKVNEVIEGLSLDAEYHDYSFEYFCDMLGYSSDSIKAKDVYYACRENYFKMIELGFTREMMEKIRESDN